MIAAEGEEKASRALREAAQVIAESPSALQVGQAETYGSIIMPMYSKNIFFLNELIAPISPAPAKVKTRPESLYIPIYLVY